MRRGELLAFIRAHKYAVEASVSPAVRPQAAVVGIAVSDTFEIVFDTLDSSRKALNLRDSGAIALVIGGTRDGDERTVQYEGIADVPSGADRERARELYFSRFPDGRERLAWPGLIHVRVRPTWIRYSNFNVIPPQIVEFDADALAGLADAAIAFQIRRADLSDVDDIAAAHLDSIRSIGSHYYEPPVVSDWCARISGDLYADAMAQGEVFFIATGDPDGKPEVLGFSSHRVSGDEHHTAVYVRGKAARMGAGSALLRIAEASARAAGAAAIHLEASLAALEFYKANGFEEIGRGEHRLSTGRRMACVFMRKQL